SLHHTNATAPASSTKPTKAPMARPKGLFQIPSRAESSSLISKILSARPLRLESENLSAMGMAPGQSLLCQTHGAEPPRLVLGIGCHGNGPTAGNQFRKPKHLGPEVRSDAPQGESGPKTDTGRGPKPKLGPTPCVPLQRRCCG